MRWYDSGTSISLHHQDGRVRDRKVLHPRRKTIVNMRPRLNIPRDESSDLRGQYGVNKTIILPTQSMARRLGVVTFSVLCMTQNSDSDCKYRNLGASVPYLVAYENDRSYF